MNHNRQTRNGNTLMVNDVVVLEIFKKISAKALKDVFFLNHDSNLLLYQTFSDKIIFVKCISRI